MNIYIKWDDSACVWTAICDELGLVLESGSYDALIERIKSAIPEMIELNKLPSNSQFFICTENRMVVY